MLSCNGDDDVLSWYSWVTNGSFCLVSITIRIQGRAICHPLYTSYAHLDATIISRINLNLNKNYIFFFSLQHLLFLGMKAIVSNSTYSEVYGQPLPRCMNANYFIVRLDLCVQYCGVVTMCINLWWWGAPLSAFGAYRSCTVGIWAYHGVVWYPPRLQGAQCAPSIAHHMPGRQAQCNPDVTGLIHLFSPSSSLPSSFLLNMMDAMMLLGALTSPAVSEGGSDNWHHPPNSDVSGPPSHPILQGSLFLCYFIYCSCKLSQTVK